VNSALPPITTETLIGGIEAPIDTVVIGGSAEFTVTVIFESDATNVAQAQEAHFNLNVHAVQVVA
jgi:hypothetical protein